MKDALIKILIVDDEPLARRRIRALLAKDADVEIVAECASGLEAVAAIRAFAPDLMFLDVQMPEMDGLSLIKTRAVEQMPLVIFVTAYNNHGLSAFEADAVDYLLKPFDRQRFEKAVRQAKMRLSNSYKNDRRKYLSELVNRFEIQSKYLKQITIRNDGRIFLVKAEQIEWIEAERNYVRLYVGQECYQRREAISSIEARLDPAQFRRIHRSTIVNINFIRELRSSVGGEYQIILLNGAELVLSRTFQKNLPEFLA